MKSAFFTRIIMIALTLSIMLGMFFAGQPVEVQAVGGISSLSCSGFISNATARNYIDVMMRYYLNNNSKLRTALDNGKNVIFMFEGGSDNYWNGSDYTNSAYDTRNQAVVIVVKKNSSGNAYIDFYSENCSSIPGDPSWCTGAAYSGSVTVMDGIYPVYTTNHTGPYAALQLDMSATNGYGYYTPPGSPDGYKNGCSGINVHTRASDISAGSDLGWAWSEGCQVIGSGSTSSNVFNDFMHSVCGISWDPWIDYYASPKNLNSFASSNLYQDVGYFVIDRQLGLTNASGTDYGSGSLINLYNKTALTNITASSTSARANADFNLDYRDGCTKYPSHVTLRAKNTASINSLPCAADTNGSVKIDSAAKGDEFVCTGLYNNHAGNYWYEIITKSGKTGYIYNTSVEYTGVDSSDVTISGASKPNGHVAGNIFYVEGTISAKYNDLTEAAVWVYSGFGTSGSKVTGGSDTASGGSYKLVNSTIDSNTAFNAISSGKYTYVVTGSYKSYFVKDEYTLMVASGTKELVNEYFVVVPSSVSQSSCTHSYSTTTLTAATCTTAGSQVKSCSKCGLVSKTTVAALGHSYGVWNTVEATCTTDGSRSRTCSTCGNVEKETLKAVGHAYNTVMKAPTCTSYGCYESTCGNCGDYKQLTGSDIPWLEQIPEGMDTALFNTKTQYRFSDYETTTSTATSLSGYTQIGSSWIQSGTKTVNYVNSWPSGFYTSNSLYSQYNKKSSKVTASETTTAKTVINSDSVVGYLWYHWCLGSTEYSSSTKTGNYVNFHAFYSTTYTTSNYNDYDSSDGSYKLTNSTACSCSPWYWPIAVYAQKSTSYTKQFTYARWGSYSAWSDTVATASDTRKVETRTVYQLKSNVLADHSYTASVQAPTCTIDGYTQYSCGVCGDSYKTNTVSATGHSYQSVTTAPTCTVAGKTVYTCHCGDSYTETIPVIGHSYNSVVTKPTCTSAGFTTHTCKSCGTSYVSDQISALGHSYKTTVTPPTCTAAGYDTHVCTVCGDSYTSNETAPRHNYVTTITAPTCTVGGFSTFRCSDCGDSFTANSTPATGHNYVSGKCTACGDVLASQVVKPTFQFTGASLVFENEIFYQFYFMPSNTADVVEYGIITFTSKLTNGTHADAVDVLPGAVAQSNGSYMVRTNGIAAKEMGDWLYFRVYAKLTDGTYAYATTYGYRATAYANTVLNGNSDTKTKALMVAMLNYGAAAQEYFGHNTDSLMNAGLTAAQKALVEPYRSDMIGAIVSADSSKTAAFPKDTTCYTPSISVSFEGAFAVNYYFTPKHTPDGELTMYYWDTATYNSISAMTRANATGVITLEKQANGSYLGAVEGIAAKDVDSTIYVALVYRSNGVEYCSGILAYSLGTYCKSVAGGNSAMQPFGAATSVYSYYAKQYFAD